MSRSPLRKPHKEKKHGLQKLRQHFKRGRGGVRPVRRGNSPRRPFGRFRPAAGPPRRAPGFAGGQRPLPGGRAADARRRYDEPPPSPLGGSGQALRPARHPAAPHHRPPDAPPGPGKRPYRSPHDGELGPGVDHRGRAVNRRRGGKLSLPENDRSGAIDPGPHGAGCERPGALDLRPGAAGHGLCGKIHRHL